MFEITTGEFIFAIAFFLSIVVAYIWFSIVIPRAIFRRKFATFQKTGFTHRAIADQIGVHKSTICRELKRNTGLRGYRPKQAHRLARARQSHITRSRILDATRTGVEELIREDWSPEQIRGHLKANGEPCVSPEWIYQYIYADKSNGGDLHTHLRCQKKRRKRYGRRERHGQIKNRVSIESRPKILDLRSPVGDWEVDTVIGKPHRLLPEFCCMILSHCRSPFCA